MLAVGGMIAILLGFVCQMILVFSFYAVKLKDGYVAYVAYMFRHPGAFFTYVFKELEPGDWRKRLVLPWIVLMIAGVVLMIVGAALDPTS
jgi:hypothetical protein